MNRILVAPGEKVYLKGLFATSYPTVRKALNGKSSSSLSLKIRKAALERGGVETEK